MSRSHRHFACETRRKVTVTFRASLGLALLSLLLIAAGVGLGAQPAHAPESSAATAPSEHQPAAGDAGHAATAEAEHEPGMLSIIARLVNFSILVGTLVYLLRSPFAQYLKNRFAQISQELANARETRRSATAQLAEIDRRIQALPGEIEALKTRGAQEITVEEKRIQQAAEAERQRLLEQTRREIDVQLQLAKRELVQHAADLAVGLATDRIKGSITTDDQMRLVDRYVDQVKSSE